MSFLDNLENNLKALENVQERNNPSERAKREEAKARSLAVAPWAEKLKSSAFTKSLLDIAAREGQQRRAKLHIVWLGNALRLELRDRRLDLQPQPDGVEAVFSEGGEEKHKELVDLAGEPAELVAKWLA